MTVEVGDIIYDNRDLESGGTHSVYAYVTDVTTKGSVVCWIYDSYKDKWRHETFTKKKLKTLLFCHKHFKMSEYSHLTEEERHEKIQKEILNIL